MSIPLAASYALQQWIIFLLRSTSLQIILLLCLRGGFLDLFFHSADYVTIEKQMAARYMQVQANCTQALAMM